MTQEQLDLLKPTQMVHLATCEGDQPRLRPMTLIVKDGVFYFATGSQDTKSGQLAANPKAEFCLVLRDATNAGYLRGSGFLRRVEDAGRRKEVADHATFIYDYWEDAADPDFALFELELKQLRHMRPGDMFESVTEY